VTLGRTCTQESRDRRWWDGCGGDIPSGFERLLSRGRGGVTCRFDRAGRAAGAGIDQVDAERLLWALLDAGLVSIREHRNRRGDWEPSLWRLTDAGEALAEPGPDPIEASVTEWLARPRAAEHPLLESIDSWLAERAATAPPMAVRLVLAIGAELGAGRTPRGRLLAVKVGGHSKAVRVADYREAIEEAFGAPLDEVVRLQARAVLVHGPIRFRVGAIEVDTSWSRPWFALTEETVLGLADLRCPATRLLTVENLMPFEEEMRAGLPPGTVAMYTGGFPGRLEMQVIRLVARAGVARIHHWGDIDLGGLRILRFLQDNTPVPVEPYRMEERLLDCLPTQPLTERDRRGLEAWIAESANPCREVAGAMLARDAKAEQEGWFLHVASTPSRDTASTGVVAIPDVQEAVGDPERRSLQEVGPIRSSEPDAKGD
jgi:hypothetical protein